MSRIRDREDRDRTVPAATMRRVACAAAVGGGLAWLLRWGLEIAGVDAAGPPLRWAGLAILAVALACVGASLVSRTAMPLRVLVALAVPVLGWALVEVVRPDGDAVPFDGVVGALAAVAGLLLWPRRGRGPRGRDHVGAG